MTFPAAENQIDRPAIRETRGVRGWEFGDTESFGLMMGQAPRPQIEHERDDIRDLVVCEHLAERGHQRARHPPPDGALDIFPAWRLSTERCADTVLAGGQVPRPGVELSSPGPVTLPVPPVTGGTGFGVDRPSTQDRIIPLLLFEPGFETRDAIGQIGVRCLG
jgi:hypothetical protein